ncbi:MAG: AAA family ATPase [Spirochaetia bacterium]|nr:AAA family ATPase [Spirochaetia bacterium]
MRPVILRMTAFGPYADEQTVDFRRLPANGIFLINGNTGSGKTVILDGMTFALYGESSGGTRGDFTAMRCQYAPDSRDTELEFTFESGEHVYKFVRTLKVHVKKNGTKELQQKQNVMSLENGGFKPMFANPKKNDLSETAEKILGLNAQQFRLVTILPQGKFEQFLVANSDDRGGILSSLFNTARWNRIAVAVKDRVTAEGNRISGEEEVIKGNLSQLGCADVKELDALIASRITESEECGRELSRLGQKKNDAFSAYSDGKKTDAFFREQSSLRQRLSDLRSDEQRISDAMELMGRIDNAEKIKPEFDCYVTGKKNLESRISDYDLAVAANDAEKNKLETARARCMDLDSAKDGFDRKKELLADYESKKELYRQLEDNRLKKNTAEMVFVSAEKEKNMLAACREKLDKNIRRLTDSRNIVINEFLLKLAGYKEERSDLEKSKDVMRQIADAENIMEKLEQEKAGLAARLERSRCIAAEYAADYKRQHQIFIDNISSTLAASLRADTPCPVCGSVHHPEPACVTDPDRHIDSEYLEELSARQIEIEKENSGLEAKLTGIEQKIAETAEDIKLLKEKMDTLSEYSAERLAEVDLWLKNADGQIDKLPELELDLKKMDEELKKTDAEFKTAEGKALDADRECSSLKAVIENLETGLPPDIPDEKSLEQKIGTLRTAIETYLNDTEYAASVLKQTAADFAAASAVLEVRKTELDLARAAAADAEEKFCECLRTMNFSDRQDFERILSESIHKKALSEEITQYKAELSHTISRLDELGQIIGDAVPPNLQQLEQNYRTLEIGYNEISGHKCIVDNEISELKNVSEKLGERILKLDADKEKYSRNLIFSRSLSGEISPYINLQRYITGVMFDSITEEANRLLDSIYGGRYLIYKSTEVKGRDKKAGLDILVYDRFYNTSRAPGSLSGGEKFLVSLALSLALSSVVQNSSGGTRLESMFIDEGFGTLDSDTINDAIAVLMNVKKKSGFVGIISHVELLKENISAQIIVEKKERGSTLRITGC